MRLTLLAILLVCLFPAGASALPVAAGSTDLSVDKTASSDTVTAGSDLAYTIVVTNNGPNGADASLADILPSDTTFQSLDVPSGFSCSTPAVGSGGTVSCSTPSLASGDSATFTLTVHVSSSAEDGSTIANTATVTTSAQDTNSGNNSSTVFTPVERNADVGITKSASPDAVPPGGTITYTIDVTNAGPSDAANVEWTDPLPSDVTFLSETQGSGPTFTCSTPPPGSGGTVDCTIASLPAGSTASFTVTVVVSPAPDSAAITNTATVTSATNDFSESPNNSSTTTTYIQTAGDLSVTKTDSPDPVEAGGTLTYTIGVTNNGAIPVGNVVLTDTIPDGTTFSAITGGPEACSAPDPGAGGTIECNIPSLGAGTTVTYTLKVTVLSSEDNGATITNTASVSSSSNTDPQPSNDSAMATTTVQASADLVLSSSDSPDPVLAGDQLTYTIDVNNNGPASAHGVTLADTLPAGTTFVSIDAPGGFSCTTPAVGAGGTVNCSGGTVDLGGAEFTLVVKVDSSESSGTMLSNTATASSTTPDPNPGDESTTATTTVNTSADLGVTKSASPGNVGQGGDITYTIDLQNNGPSDATNTSLSDTLPAGTTFKSFTQDSGPAFSCTTGATVTCTKASFAAGAEAKFTLVATVGPTVSPGSTISNTATASTTTTESDSGNNSATADTTVEAKADLAVTKSDSPDPVTAGTNLTYTLGVTNNGPQAATGVSLSDDLPGVTTFVSASAPAGFSCTTPAVGSGGNVTCTSSSMANGASATITLVVHVASDRASGSTVSNTATVTRNEADPNSANDSATSTTSVATSADLSTSVSDSPDPVDAGNVVTYHMHIHNGGPSGASQPRLSVAIPSGTTLVGAAQTDGSAFHCTSDGVTVTCAADSLANGAGAAIDMAVKTAHSQSGTISASPKASSSTSDPNSSNDTSSETTTITPAPPTARPTSVTIGRTVSKRRSGSLIVTIACNGAAGQTCPVTVTVSFRPPHDDLAPISAGKTIKAGRRTIVYVIGPRSERRRIKRIHTLPVHVSVTNRTGTGAERDTIAVETR